MVDNWWWFGIVHSTSFHIRDVEQVSWGEEMGETWWPAQKKWNTVVRCWSSLSFRRFLRTCRTMPSGESFPLTFVVQAQGMSEEGAMCGHQFPACKLGIPSSFHPLVSLWAMSAMCRPFTLHPHRPLEKLCCWNPAGVAVLEPPAKQGWPFKCVSASSWVEAPVLVFWSVWPSVSRTFTTWTENGYLGAAFSQF